MQEPHGKISTYLFYTLIILEVLIVIFLSFRRHENISFQNEPFYSLNSGWTYTDESGTTQVITIPAHLDAGKDNTVSIRRIIPKNIEHLTALSILTTHQSLEAYVDNKLIYSRISDPYHGLFDVPSGNLWNIIPLPSDYGGKVITLKISSDYDDYAGNVQEVQAGTKAALLIHNLLSSGLSLVLAVITLMSGILMLMTYLFLHRLLGINRSILFLGWFTILCSVWMIMESNLTQVFIENESVISALTYLSLMTLPIPIILYITLIDNYHYTKTIYNLAYTFLGSAFLLILLQVINIFDFHETSIIVRVEIFMLLGSVLITLLLEMFRYKNKEIRAFTISAVIFFIFGTIELLTFRTRSFGNTGVIFQIGFMIFIIILLWDTLKKVAEIIKLSESAKQYKLLATRDLLTNCRNRVSYAKDMERVSLERNFTMFVADMDNMKQINDTYGHHAGDEAIILSSQCLLKVFGRRVYRIGGDEFVSIQYDLDQEKINSMLEEFTQECEKANEDFPYPITMSIGYAVFDRNSDKTIYDTIERADKAMYDQKNKGASKHI